MLLSGHAWCTTFVFQVLPATSLITSASVAWAMFLDGPHTTGMSSQGVLLLLPVLPFHLPLSLGCRCSSSWLDWHNSDLSGAPQRGQTTSEAGLLAGLASKLRMERARACGACQWGLGTDRRSRVGLIVPWASCAETVLEEDEVEQQHVSPRASHLPRWSSGHTHFRSSAATWEPGART
ncbi:unnamed protein product [Prorocentrum cordatum]|uniref:Secreted protein n=1 Tax=Prorocentrum cordatum TaxID=2364126 RepID=A0ABN9Q996_9DINO|nr:unnamed protein product [Polarella glacialis]